MIDTYRSIREHTTKICKPLTSEDSTIQPIVDVSPPKWHLAHTTWFFETFILIPYLKNYKVYDSSFNFLFNSYYEGIGNRVPRDQRGYITRPGLKEILDYRHYVDDAMKTLLTQENLDVELSSVLELGLQHEQQHQELLCTDIKLILSFNPLFPVYGENGIETLSPDRTRENKWIDIKEGIYEIGYKGDGFCFDNELGRHKVYLHGFQVQSRVVKNIDYVAFINDGGYQNYEFWLADGWEWVKSSKAVAPLYWLWKDEGWKNFTLNGLIPLDLNDDLCHVNFYEADAYARWKKARLLTEFEWEIAAPHIQYGSRWEWTNSAYLPYPYFEKPAGAIGEYNGKFMINQMVLRGGSAVSPPGHVRATYRNFFPPEKQWQYSGIRLAKSL